MITVTLANISLKDTVEFIQTDGNSVGVRIEGHALFGKNGLSGRGFFSRFGRKGDIVCAAVSALSLNLARSIMIIGDIKPYYRQDKGLLEIMIDWRDLKGQKGDVVSILVESFLIGIIDIQQNYPHNIDIITRIEN